MYLCCIYRNVQGKVSQNKRSIAGQNSIANISHNLATTDLALRNRPDPRQAKVERNNHAAHDPEHTGILSRVVAEDDGKDDTTEVTSRANNTRQDTVSVRVDVGDERKVSAVASFHEDSHESN